MNDNCRGAEMQHTKQVLPNARDPRIMTLIALLSLVVASAWGCTPDPRSQACTTDDVCREALGKTAYCVNSHCVECVTNATCGERKHCVSGVCEWK
jgi:hypothetical protein